MPIPGSYRARARGRTESPEERASSGAHDRRTRDRLCASIILSRRSSTGTMTRRGSDVFPALFHVEHLSAVLAREGPPGRPGASSPGTQFFAFKVDDVDPHPGWPAPNPWIVDGRSGFGSDRPSRVRERRRETRSERRTAASSSLPAPSRGGCEEGSSVSPSTRNLFHVEQEGGR
jgi:hypothetical protein